MPRAVNHIILILAISLSPFTSLASGFVLDTDMHKKLVDRITKDFFSQNHKEAIEVSYQKQISLNIADEAINRISFGHARISKIIGNVSRFTSILSDDGASLFITPKLPKDSHIDFAVLLSSGVIIDMSLTVVKSKKPYLISLKIPNSSKGRNKSEVVLLIDAMKNEMVGKYYVEKARSNVTIPNKEKIKATSGDIYSFKDLRGTILTLTNKNKKVRGDKSDDGIEITDNDLIKAFKGVVGVHIDNKYLKRREKTKDYIVFKEDA